MSGELQVEYRAVSSLIPYARNARTHSEEQIDQISASIKEFGFTNPVLVSPEGDIIAGHGRVQAAKNLGLTEVPTIALRNLTAEQKKAYVIADNQLALNAGWDFELLKLDISELSESGFDLSHLGFEEKKLSEILFGKEKPKKKPKNCPNCGHEF